jgi:hypothetical protein
MYVLFVSNDYDVLTFWSIFCAFCHHNFLIIFVGTQLYNHHLKRLELLHIHFTSSWGNWDSVVGTVIRCELDCSGIKSQQGRDFPHPSRLTLGPTQLPIQWVLSHFPGCKVAEVWR